MTIDTNVVIAYLDDDDSVVSKLTSWRKQGAFLILSTVVESELLAFTSWTPQQRAMTEQFIEENFTSIAFDRSIARVAANIRRLTKIKFPDAAIAATALWTHSPLVTRNQKDFQKVPGLEIITL